MPNGSDALASASDRGAVAALVMLAPVIFAGCAAASPADERAETPAERPSSPAATPMREEPRGERVSKADRGRDAQRDESRRPPTLSAWLSTETANLEPTSLMILGSPHLAQEFDEEDFDPSLLDPVVSAVSDFGPTVVGVEARPPSQIWALRERGDRDDWATILERFAPTTVKLGDRAADILALDWGEARRRQRELLNRAEAEGLSPEARRRLVLLSLRAYDLPTATLQWRYLPDEERTAGDITESLASELDSRLNTPNETVQIGLRVAYEQGLQRVHSLDDQMSLALQTEEEHVEIATTLQDSGLQADIQDEYDALRSASEEEASSAGDLLPVYLLLNSERYMRADAGLQWAAFFDDRMDEELGRTRIARREVRDLTIASNVRAMTARYPGERALIVYGASHKSFLESYLRDMIDLAIVQFEDYVTISE